MKRDNQCFTHDYNAIDDPEIQDMLFDIGAEGYGIYWATIETLYQSRGTYSLSGIKFIAYKAHADQSVTRKVILDYGLFENDGEIFWSNAQQERQKIRDELIEKKRRGGLARAEGVKNGASAQQNISTCSADAQQMQSKLNKIKLNKIKDNNAIALSGEANNELFPKKKQDEYDITPREIFDIWNKTAKEHGGILPSMSQFNESRKQKIKVRMAEFSKVPDTTVRGVYLMLLQKVYESRLLRGEKTGWKADFDWLFRDSNNWDKVLNGKYDDRTTNASADGYDRLHITATSPEDYEGDF